MSLNLIAKYYDILYGDVDDDLWMWDTLTHDPGGDLLEIGCGTGRLLLPLAKAGHRLTGIDLSEVALQTARAKIEAAGLTRQVTLQQADMRNFDLPQKNFAMALLPLNTFMHLHTVHDQLATLNAIFRHLAADGLLVIDLFNPDPTMLAEADGRLYFEDEVVNKTSGYLVQWYWRHDIELDKQMRHLTYVLDEIDEQGVVHRVQIPFSLRFCYRFEMELLLRASGFNVETIFGSYELEPFHGHSPRMIFMAAKLTEAGL
jgi:SAM-dependent methyltransferase